MGDVPTSAWVLIGVATFLVAALLVLENFDDRDPFCW